MRLIWRRLLAVFVVACVTTWAHESYDVLSDVDTTLAPFSLIGVALGIFLGFRNNASYDRFWEGRKLWGQIVNASRTITRQILVFVGPVEGGEEEREHHRAAVYRVIAYVHLLRHHLRREDDFTEVEGLLSERELEALRVEHNRPVALLQMMGLQFRKDWERGWIDSFHLPVLEGSLTELTGVQGGCERIKNTPIPYSYSLLLHRIVGIYCFMLPFGLVVDVGMVTPLVVLFVSYAFLGLDAIGGEIEDPFGYDPNDLPLSQLTRMIEVNLRQRLGETDLPDYHQPVDNLLV